MTYGNKHPFVTPPYYGTDLGNASACDHMHMHDLNLCTPVRGRKKIDTTYVVRSVTDFPNLCR